ncbi:MAG TPA: hypothetical protein VIN11_06935 [Roseivirga sp.]
MKKVVTLILALSAMNISFAQDLNLPEDPAMQAEARRRFALSVDAMSVDKYREAANSLSWLMKNAPDLYDGLYINGYKAYEGLAEAEKDEAKQNVLLDSMFICFDLKSKYFELTDLEKNNEAYRYYKYWKANKSKMSEAMEAYDIAYENPSEVINNNIVSYMDIARRYKAYGNALSNDEVLEIYGKVMDVIDLKEQAGDDVEKLERYKTAVNSLLTQIIGDDLNCEFINKNLAPPLDQNNDPKLAKKIFGLLLGQSCSDSPYFLKAAEIIQASEPTEGIAKVIAQRAFAAKDYPKAEKYYKEAANLSTDPEKKADLLLDMTKLYIAQSNKPEARKVALEAAKLDATKESEALTLVANMYMNSFNECSQQKSQIDDRAIYMAAYDLYQKAGNSEGMAQARAQFPTVSDVFTANKKEGEAIRVGCWINVSTTIKTRPTN